MIKLRGIIIFLVFLFINILYNVNESMVNHWGENFDLAKTLTARLFTWDPLIHFYKNTSWEIIDYS